MHHFHALTNTIVGGYPDVLDRYSRCQSWLAVFDGLNSLVDQVVAPWIRRRGLDHWHQGTCGSVRWIRISDVFAVLTELDWARNPCRMYPSYLTTNSISSMTGLFWHSWECLVLVMRVATPFSFLWKHSLHMLCGRSALRFVIRFWIRQRLLMWHNFHALRRQIHGIGENRGQGQLLSLLKITARDLQGRNHSCHRRARRPWRISPVHFWYRSMLRRWSSTTHAIVFRFNSSFAWLVKTTSTLQWTSLPGSKGLNLAHSAIHMIDITIVVTPFPSALNAQQMPCFNCTLSHPLNHPLSHRLNWTFVKSPWPSPWNV